MITDYTVITAINSRELTEGVYGLIEEGWQPLGGVSLAYERNIHRILSENDVNLPNDFEHCAQAMVKYD